MKKLKLALAALAATLVISTSTVFASFPVKKEQKSEQTVSTQTLNNIVSAEEAKKLTTKENTKVSPAVDANGLDEKWILVLLWFFLGGFAAHRWYAKKPVGWNILYIITFGGCGIWAIVDLINILTDNFN